MNLGIWHSLVITMMKQNGMVLIVKNQIIYLFVFITLYTHLQSKAAFMSTKNQISNDCVKTKQYTSWCV